MKDIQLILSGSSDFDIKNNIDESLTGRKWEYIMYPILWRELVDTIGYVQAMQQLDTRVVYGMYPEIIAHQGEEIERLKLLVDSYLYKDILAFNNLKKPEFLDSLLKALAFHIGAEVSYNELAQLLRVDTKTVQHYIQILIKAFVLFPLTGYHRNLRNELKMSKKIYFWDTGLRNAIIGNFQPLGLRIDKGALWENYVIAERMKRNRYEAVPQQSYFWRTTSQQEIDYLEVKQEVVSAFEIKWSEQSKIKKLQLFRDTYQTDIQLIDSKNFNAFLK